MGVEVDAFIGGIAEPGLCKADVHYGDEVDAFGGGRRVVAVPVHYGVEVDACCGYFGAEPGLCKADVHYVAEVDALGVGVVAEPGVF